MLTTTGLTKTFTRGKDTVEAVTGIDLDVADGELVALLGPNGAGKSTTLRMLTTLLAPTSGSATIAGLDIERDRDAVRRTIGYVGQGNGGGYNQRVRDELLTQGACYGLSGAQSAARAAELMDDLELTELAKRTVSTLSGGQKRRLDIALGLVHRPALLFLDEPSTGMDPQARANLWEHILRLREQSGTTILLTTHYLDEADAMAERVVVIDHGAIIADDTASALKSELAGDLVRLGVATATDAEEVRSLADTVPGLRELRIHGTTVELRVDAGTTVLPDLVRRADTRAVRVLTAEVVRPTLDDVFLELTGRSLREHGDLAATPS